MISDDFWLEVLHKLLPQGNHGNLIFLSGTVCVSSLEFKEDAARWWNKIADLLFSMIACPEVRKEDCSPPLPPG